MVAGLGGGPGAAVHRVTRRDMRVAWLCGAASGLVAGLSTGLVLWAVFGA